MTVPEPELALCFSCARTRDCLESNLGWICRECFRKARDEARDPSIGVAPPAGMKAWFIVDGVGPNCYITIHGKLHAFQHVEDAQWTLVKLKEGGVDTRAMRIEERSACEAFLYAWMVGLGMDHVTGVNKEAAS